MLNLYSPEDASKGLFEVYEPFSRGFLTMFWLFHSLWTKTLLDFHFLPNRYSQGFIHTVYSPRYIKENRPDLDYNSTVYTTEY